jgi:hypothetical protein
VGAQSRWWMPLRFVALHADPGFRRLADAERWKVVEALSDAWFLGSIEVRPEGVSDAVWDVVMRLWPEYAADLVKGAAIAERRREAAQKRWDANASQLQGKPRASRVHVESTSNATNQLSTINNQSSGKSSSKRGRRAPSDFAPDASHMAIAEERGLDLDAQLASFADYEFAAPKSDWAATFRNWLRRAQVTRRDGGRAHPTDVALARFLGGAA